MLDALRRYWEGCPHLALGQIVSFLSGQEDPARVEDAHLEAALVAGLGGGEPQAAPFSPALGLDRVLDIAEGRSLTPDEGQNLARALVAAWATIRDLSTASAQVDAAVGDEAGQIDDICTRAGVGEEGTLAERVEALAGLAQQRAEELDKLKDHVELVAVAAGYEGDPFGEGLPNAIQRAKNRLEDLEGLPSEAALERLAMDRSVCTLGTWLARSSEAEGALYDVALEMLDQGLVKVEDMKAARRGPLALALLVLSSGAARRSSTPK
jgi:hypothetical protein